MGGAATEGAAKFHADDGFVAHQQHLHVKRQRQRIAPSTSGLGARSAPIASRTVADDWLLVVTRLALPVPWTRPG